MRVDHAEVGRKGRVGRGVRCGSQPLSYAKTQEKMQNLRNNTPKRIQTESTLNECTDEGFFETKNQEGTAGFPGKGWVKKGRVRREEQSVKE